MEKFGWFIGDALGGIWMLLGVIERTNDWKESVLFVIGGMYLLVRVIMLALKAWFFYQEKTEALKRAAFDRRVRESKNGNYQHR